MPALKELKKKEQPANKKRLKELYIKAPRTGQLTLIRLVCEEQSVTVTLTKKL
jgi:hypothetical protein